MISFEFQLKIIKYMPLYLSSVYDCSDYIAGFV